VLHFDYVKSNEVILHSKSNVKILKTSKEVFEKFGRKVTKLSAKCSQMNVPGLTGISNSIQPSWYVHNFVESSFLRTFVIKLESGLTYVLLSIKVI
jgi:hypothetical protein